MQFIDTLLSTGGINEMLETISIILLVMAYAGIMQHCGLMVSMVEPIVRGSKNFVALAGATVFSGALFNVLARPISGDHDVDVGLPRQNTTAAASTARRGAIS